MNRVFMIGNLTKDPERSETANGTAYCFFTIAVNRPFTDADGNREADFFNVQTWRGQAENCGRYLKKGSKVAVEGRLQNRSYKTKEGEERRVTEIVADGVEFLSRSDNTTENGEKKPQTATQKTFPENKPTLEEIDDDLPF